MLLLLILPSSFLIVLCITSVANGDPLDEHLLSIRQLINKAAFMVADEASIPFSSDPPLVAGELLTTWKRQIAAEDEQGKIRTALLIDGIAAFSTSLVSNIPSAIRFHRSDVYDISLYLRNTTFLPQIGDVEQLVPAIRIGENGGASVVIAGIPINGIEPQFVGKSDTHICKHFYNSFLTWVLYPAINSSTSTDTFLRYSSILQSVVDGDHFYNTQSAIIEVPQHEWAAIAAKMDEFRERFFLKTKWKLFLGIHNFEHTLRVQENYDTTDVLHITGLSTFLDEASICHFKLDLILEFTSSVQDSVILPNEEILFEMTGEKSLDTGKRKVTLAPTLGLGDYSELLVTGNETLNLIMKRLFFPHKQKHHFFLQHFTELTREFEAPVCGSVLDSMRLQKVHVHYGIRMGMNPKNYYPHQHSPASEIITTGLDAKRLSILKRDFSYWNNILSQINANRFPTRFVFSIDIPMKLGITELNVASYSKGNMGEKTCLGIMMESFYRSVYGSMDSETGKYKEPGIVKRMENAVSVVSGVSTHARTSVGAAYLMMLCPIANAYTARWYNANETLPALYDIESFLTVHLGEHLIRHLFDGGSLKQNNYSMYNDIYGIGKAKTVILTNAEVAGGEHCSGLVTDRHAYLRSIDILRKLPEGHMIYPSAYTHPASYQRFFIMRQISLSGNTLNCTSPLIARLYLDSCIIFMRHMKPPLIPVHTTDEIHNWLSLANYRRYQGREPEDTVSAEVVAQMLMQNPLLANSDVIAASILRAASVNSHSLRSRTQAHFSGSARRQEFGKTCRETIKMHLYSHIVEYVLEGNLQVFYAPSSTYISARQHNDLFNTTSHCKISLGAKRLFLMSKIPQSNVSRENFSVPGHLTFEIIDDVFKSMQAPPLNISSRDLEHLNFIRVPVLPMIFRIWYGTSTGRVMQSYDIFLQHAAYVLCLYLSSVFKDRITQRFYIACPHNTAATGVNKGFLRDLGLLSTRGDPIPLANMKDVYRLWWGASDYLEQPRNPPDPSLQFFNSSRLNRFHYTQSDCSYLNINSKPENKQQLHHYGHPIVPDIYFFTLQPIENISTFEMMQRTAAVLRVAPAHARKRWIQDQDPAAEPKFLPLFGDRDADTVAGRLLYENVYSNMHEWNGHYIRVSGGKAQVVWDQANRTRVKKTDFIDNYQDAILTQETNRCDNTPLEEQVMLAWKSQTFVECSTKTDTGQCLRRKQNLVERSHSELYSEPSYTNHLHHENNYSDVHAWEIYHDLIPLLEDYDRQSQARGAEKGDRYSIRQWRNSPRQQNFRASKYAAEPDLVPNPFTGSAHSYTVRTEYSYETCTLIREEAARPTGKDSNPVSTRSVLCDGIKIAGMPQRNRVTKVCTPAHADVKLTLEGNLTVTQRRGRGNNLASCQPVRALEKCSLFHEGQDRRRIICLGSIIIVDNVATSDQQCVNEPRKGPTSDRYRFVSTPNIKDNYASNFTKEACIGILGFSSEDWYVTKTARNNTFFHAVELLLIGKPKSINFSTDLKARFLSYCTSLTDDDARTRIDKPSVAECNKNLFSGTESETFDSLLMHESLRASLEQGRIDARSFKLLSYFLGQVIHVLHASEHLYWERVSWEGTTNQNHFVNAQVPPFKFGPPYVFLYETTSSVQQLQSIVHKASMQKYLEGTKEDNSNFKTIKAVPLKSYLRNKYPTIKPPD